MRTGVCPKCASCEVFASDDGGGIGGNGYLMEAKDGGPRNTYQWETLLCADCGYYENYILDTRMLANVKANPRKTGWRKLES